MKLKTQKQTGEFSQFNYEEITNLVKHNKPLAELIEKLFNTYDDVVVFGCGWKYDVEYNIFAQENLDHKNDEFYPSDGWEQSELEINYEKLLQHNEGIDEEDGEPYEFVSGEGDAFNWSKVRVDDNRCVVVRDEGDYIAIEILSDDNLVDGVIDLWEFNEH